MRKNKHKTHTRFKAVRKIMAVVNNPRRLTALIVILLFAFGGVYTLLFSHAAGDTVQLSLSPATQSVTSGSDIVVNVLVNTNGASINAVQSVLSYSSTNFSLVSITPGADFTSFPTPVESSGSIEFSAASTTAVTGSQTVATVTLEATGTGTSPISLATVCPAGNFALTCSAAYDSVTSDNDMGGTTPITNGSYTVTPILPTVPAGLHSTATTTTSVALAWTASTDTGGPGLTGYHIYRNGTLVASTSGTTYTNTGLSANTTYTYAIAAYDSAGNASAISSPAVSVTTEPLPTVPTGLHSTATSITSVALAWTASTDTGGPGLTGYHLYRGGVLIASPTGTTYTDTGLTAKTAYSYTIAAYDSAGNASATSSAVIITTIDAPTTPAALHSTLITATSVALAWTASTDTGGPGLTGYHIYRSGVLEGSTSGTTYTDGGLTANTAYSYTVAAYDSSGNISAVSSPATSITTEALVGDLDGDGQVTGHDLSLLLAHYSTNWVPGEFDGTTVVEAHDLSLLLSNYGKT
jgi:chitodextrinase